MPGSVNEAAWSVSWRKAWAAANVTRAVANMTVKTVAANTAALAHRTGSRAGTAVSEERIMPVAYSPAVIRMPRTIRHS